MQENKASQWWRWEGPAALLRENGFLAGLWWPQGGQNLGWQRQKSQWRSRTDTHTDTHALTHARTYTHPRTQKQEQQEEGLWVREPLLSSVLRRLAPRTLSSRMLCGGSIGSYLPALLCGLVWASTLNPLPLLSVPLTSASLSHLLSYFLFSTANPISGVVTKCVNVPCCLFLIHFSDFNSICQTYFWGFS